MKLYSNGFRFFYREIHLTGKYREGVHPSSLQCRNGMKSLHSVYPCCERSLRKDYLEDGNAEKEIILRIIFSFDRGIDFFLALNGRPVC